MSSNANSFIRYHDDPEDVDHKNGPSGLHKFVALILIVFLAGFGYTYAANVSLGSSSNEFGQGIQVTTACSGNNSITILPTNSFINSSGGGAYKLSGLTLSNIPSTCYGNDLIISVYDTGTSSVPLAIYNSTSNKSYIFVNSGSFKSGINGTGQTVATNSSSSVTVTFTSPVAFTAGIRSFAIESALHIAPCAEGGGCVLGDSGPAGGIVFIKTAAKGGLGGSYSYEAWTADLSASTMAWNNVSTVINTADTIGSGPSNALLFTGGAGLACKNATYGGYSDWFLPSRDELQQLWNQRSLLSGFQTNGYGYWSSSENAAVGTTAYAIRWTDGMGYSDAYASKTSPANTGYARCVRRF